MAKVAVLPAVLISDRKVMETRKFDAPEPSVAAATPRPRNRNGKTSETRIQAMGPILNAKQVIYTIRHTVATMPSDDPTVAWL